MRIRAAVAILLALAAMPGPSPAAADAASDLVAAQARAQVIESVRARLGSQLATALQTQEQIAQSLRDNAVQQSALQASIAVTEGKITGLDEEIAKLDHDISAENVRILNEKAQIASLARAIYAQPSSLLLMLVEARSLGDMINRVNDLRSAGSHAQALKAQLKLDVARLDRDRAQVRSDRDDMLKLRDQETADLGKLKELQAKQLKAQDDLANQIAATRYELYRIDSQSTTLAQQIADLLQEQETDIIAAAESAVWDQVQTIHPAGIPTVISSGHSRKYRLMWPLPTSIQTQPFGPSSFWFEPPYQQYPHFHTGLDMSSPEGSPVLAADDGVVILAGASVVNGVLVGYGNYVVIAHAGGYTTLYGHLLRLVVRVGEQLTQGQVIGNEGSTGNSTGAHLHFELRQGTTPIDPAPFLPPGPPSDFRG